MKRLYSGVYYQVVHAANGYCWPLRIGARVLRGRARRWARSPWSAQDWPGRFARVRVAQRYSERTGYMSRRPGAKAPGRCSLCNYWLVSVPDYVARLCPICDRQAIEEIAFDRAIDEMWKWDELGGSEYYGRA